MDSSGPYQISVSVFPAAEQQQPAQGIQRERGRFRHWLDGDFKTVCTGVVDLGSHNVVAGNA